MQNAEQILTIMTATVGGELFGTAPSDDFCLRTETEVEDLACRWRKLVESSTAAGATSDLDQEWASNVSQVRNLKQVQGHKYADDALQWLRDAQRLLSSMASNYDIPRLALGQIFAVAATLLAVLAAHQDAGKASTAAVLFTLITTAYGAMMFASSYVEEEHHFWYYTASAWLAFISWKGFTG